MQPGRESFYCVSHNDLIFTRPRRDTEGGNREWCIDLIILDLEMILEHQQYISNCVFLLNAYVLDKTQTMEL